MYTIQTLNTSNGSNQCFSKCYGLRVGLANSVVAVALLLLGNHFSPLVGVLAVSLALLSGALCGVLVSGLAPLVESVFSYTTAIKLLELANREQSVLRDLELRAPGTYHHSMMVGHLAEKAAEEIGANALLAKVAGYYHDIGKMRRPQFFVENVAVTQGENRHEKLSPSMSARIIQAHVKDGVEMAEKEKLALPIRQGIAEHHGTSVIRFFYEKAKELANPDKGEVVREHDYRYPGPRPQTREAGILMLAGWTGLWGFIGLPEREVDGLKWGLIEVLTQKFYGPQRNTVIRTVRWDDHIREDVSDFGIDTCVLGCPSAIGDYGVMIAAKQIEVLRYLLLAKHMKNVGRVNEPLLSFASIRDFKIRVEGKGL